MSTKKKLKKKKKRAKNKEKEEHFENIEDLLVVVDMWEPYSRRKGRKLNALMETIRDVDLNSEEAELNASSISDDNGGRIELDLDSEDETIVEK